MNYECLGRTGESGISIEFRQFCEKLGTFSLFSLTNYVILLKNNNYNRVNILKNIYYGAIFLSLSNEM